MKISIVLPVFDEEKNIPLLHKELTDVLKQGYDYEIIWVNDASRDASLVRLKETAALDRHTKVISFRYRAGQTAAMSAGIQKASGDIIIPMDADLQNDPHDIPRFIEKINEGFDVVSGWRKDRQDKALSRRLPSVIANSLIRLVTRVNIHDYGCSMKAYRRDLIQGIQLYGEMHRFIPAYAGWQGARVTEIIVNHRPRLHGTTKYGISRTLKVLLDLVVVKFLSRYMNRPMHFFGALGFMSLGVGVIAGATSIILKVMDLKSFVETPLPIWSALFIIVGVQLAAMGVIAEMIMRVYYESQGKASYRIAETINM